MKTRDFTQLSGTYEKTSLVQNSASSELFDLLDIGKNEDVLDLGCGTGHLTKTIREITSGKVVGIDLADGMIQEARRNYGHLDISFEICSAYQLEYVEQFDVIFCNSAFQWFNPPEFALQHCYQALRKNGRIGIQAPARKVYSPNFIEAVERIQGATSTMKVFAKFENPWFFRDTSEEYASVFHDVGFDVISSRIDEVTTSYTPEEVFGVFESGAAAGYLNQTYYSVSITQEYINSFKTIVRKSFENQVNDEGKVDLTFFRIYLIARKY